MPKDTQMNNQAIRKMTKQTQKQGSFYRNHFAEHNYNYVNRPQTTISSRTNTQNHLFSQSQILQQPSSNSVNFHDCPQSSQDQSENYPFLQQNKINTQRNHSRHQTPYYTSNYFPADDEEHFNQNNQ